MRPPLYLHLRSVRFCRHNNSSNAPIRGHDHTLVDLLANFTDHRHISAEATEEFDIDAAVKRQAHIFDHLARAHFDDQNHLRATRSMPQSFDREGPETYRAEKSGTQTFFPQAFDNGTQNARGDAITDQENLRLFGTIEFVARFRFRRLLVFVLEFQNVGLQLIWLEIN